MVIVRTFSNAQALEEYMNKHKNSFVVADCIVTHAHDSGGYNKYTLIHP